MIWEIEIAITVAGVGELRGQNRTVLTEVDAATIDEALTLVRKDFMQIAVVAVRQKPGLPQPPPGGGQ